ncbi:hypothetical protein H6G89_18945 [Oscillatoria sp. FACHB-1407]|uniref:hypothetical protein n=1 Tax=Oscillatoria sp. FACHB-1407 TaxID=2692847 RepID=UPI001681DD44|nr:hypothetical protein [Oscillatoria sp. FACHB-1407]MBD2463117.1 hypothetical protein [Oscillatoria sp. FACHB-1407]
MNDPKVAIVTEGGQEIDKATVLKFLQAGYRVVVADVDAQAGKEVVARVYKHHQMTLIRRGQ